MKIPAVQKRVPLDSVSYWKTNFFQLFTPFFLDIKPNINLLFVTIFLNKKRICITKAVVNSIYFEYT
jgi:hypothetical protein